MSDPGSGWRIENDMHRHRATNSWPNRSDVLVVARRTNRCEVLGPGVRAVIWVQGCPFRCPGCIAPETLPFTGGSMIQVDALASELVALDEISGITFSGGEPMSQAAGLSALIDLIRAKRDLSFMSYTGYTLSHLRNQGSKVQNELLDRLDLVVDGTFVQSKQTDLIWRGSDNQQVHLLSERHLALRSQLQDRGYRVEMEVDNEGHPHWMGILPPGFRGLVELSFKQQGIVLEAK
jgi:anaerobic ribonucleoside-triphosphate reductase activating protein